VLINAGPTYEAIDPVRYIGNHSTGKMGVAIAEECAKRGATVRLILGTESVRPEDSRIQIENIVSSDDILDACQTHFQEANVIVLAAAVADYKPATVSAEKIKKKQGQLTMELMRTPDIASTLGKIKKKDQILIGFALETQDGESHAKEKLIQKNLDMIVLNNPRDKGAGFGHDTNKVSFLYPDNKQQNFELKTKKAVAHDIVNAIHKMIQTYAKK
jgi:phosphopantothenoylcysteine decarboxylase/phosphopantothenate--cysteine ligase